MSSSQPQFADTKGDLYHVPGATPVAPPSSSSEPSIPSTAQKVILDDSNSWQGVHDEGTPGTATGSTKYLGAGKGRLFSFSFTDNGGFRWHNMFAKDTVSTHFCYEVTVMFDKTNILGQLELDVTQVTAPTDVVYLCTQANSNHKAWDYTTTPTGKCQWNKSNVAVNPAGWPVNQFQSFKIYTQRDAKGNVTYPGVTMDGVWYPFDPSCKGYSMLDQKWDVGHTLVNFQMNGRATSGSINATAKDIVVYRW